MKSLPTSETYSELQKAYDFFNERLFNNTLPPCLITLQREKRTYGYFSSKRFVGRKNGLKVDEIAMNPSFFVVRSVEETLSTLVHEMVHLWQAHFGKPGRRGYHNKEWGQKMDSIGLCPSNTGKEGGKRTGEQMSHYIVIGKDFDIACAELITTEFTLSWLDRFPPQMPSAPIQLTGRGEDFPSTEENDDGDEDLIILPPATPVNKSNRVKYRCPSCMAQVWGKPSLLIKCGEVDCNSADFEAIAD